MKYIDYTNLGFKRHDMNDNVEYKNTGYYGFALEKKLKNKQMICVCSGELDKPKLYIPHPTSLTYHIIPITPAIVKSLCEVDKKK